MNKRVHEIAKQHGLPAKEGLEKLRAAGIEVKAAPSGVDDEEAESRPGSERAGTALAEPDAIRINSGSTVKDVAKYLDVAVPEVMKKLMAMGEMKTLTQTLSDESILVLATELGKDVEI